MSGGQPPYYGFTGNPWGQPPNYNPQFPTAPLHGAPQFPGHGHGGIPTQFPQQIYPTPTTNFYPAGETHFTTSMTPVSHTSFAPEVAGPRWISWRHGQPLPAHAVVGGRDCDGSTIYVGRVQHKRDLLPAKVIPMKNAVYICYDGKEISYTSCEILCMQRSNWVRSSHGNIPPGAIPVGNTDRGETLYAGRFHHGGSITVGKLHPSHRMCYIPFDGKEVGKPEYEVLTG